uniref:hypothetical protein n=1 Tax=Sahlingia subintegra TaxID=468936 RepID=UPI001FCD95D2|nr:hypothetical protein MW427_pgp149 [Sahlingia subintegra]UNJ17277.1 hypothetical protein [Sahlingia subintegra]
MNKLFLLLMFILKTVSFQSSTFFNPHIPLQSYDYHQAQKTKPKYQLQKKIIVVDKRNQHLNKFIRNLFNLDFIEQSDKEIGKEEIHNLLTNMKKSGYFHKIHIKSKIINKLQTIIIECTSMPEITSIIIQNNKGLIIPEKLIEKFFDRQLGCPQNFQIINDAVKKIYKWYYDKGYQWVNIKVVQEEKNPNIIILKIAEGVVDSIQFKFSNQISRLLSKNNSDLLQQLRDFLNIKENCRLNYYDIETRLTELKQKQIFDTCDYTVLQSETKDEKIDLLISIYELPDKTTLLLGQNNSFNSGIIEKIESKIFNSINTLFKEFIYVHYQVEREINEQQNRPINIREASSIPMYSYNSQAIINRTMTEPLFFFPKDLYEWYAKPLHFIKCGNLALHYNIQNIGKQKEFIKMRFKLPAVHKNFILTYCKPWINLYKKQTGLIQIKFFRQSFYSKHKKMSNLLSQMFNHRFIFLDSLSTIKTCKSKIKIQLSNNWGLKETFRLESIEHNTTSIKKRTETSFSTNLEYLNKLNLYPYLFSYTDPQLTNHTYSKFISIDTKLRYKFNYNYDIDWLKTGNNFMVISKYSIPSYDSAKKKLANYYTKFSQRTIFKYILYQNFDFSKQKQIFDRHFAFLDVEIGNLIGSSMFFPWFEKFELRFPDYILNNNNRIPNFPKSLYRIRCEYHLNTPKNHSLFFFFNYIYSNERPVFYRTKDALTTLSKTNGNYNNNDRINTGIGYQLKTSIHRLPPIRIECSIGPKSEPIIYFKIIEVLSSIAVHKKY